MMTFANHTSCHCQPKVIRTPIVTTTQPPTRETRLPDIQSASVRRTQSGYRPTNNDIESSSSRIQSRDRSTNNNGESSSSSSSKIQQENTPTNNNDESPQTRDRPTNNNGESSSSSFSPSNTHSTAGSSARITISSANTAITSATNRLNTSNKTSISSIEQNHHSGRSQSSEKTQNDNSLTEVVDENINVTGKSDKIITNRSETTDVSAEKSFEKSLDTSMKHAETPDLFKSDESSLAAVREQKSGRLHAAAVSILKENISRSDVEENQIKRKDSPQEHRFVH